MYVCWCVRESTKLYCELTLLVMNLVSFFPEVQTQICLTPNSCSFHTLPFHKCAARTHVKTPIFLFYTIYCSKQTSWQSFPGDGDGCHVMFWMPAHPSVPIPAWPKSVRCLITFLGWLHRRVNFQVCPQLRASLACT